MPGSPQTPGSPGIRALCILLGWSLLLTLSSHAARPSKTLPPIDRRPSALLTRPSDPSVDRRDAEDRLRALVPSVRIEYDPVSGAAKHIRCLDGCLTGPGGAGGSVSKPTLQALPRQLSHRPFRAFLSEHGSLLNARPESLDISAPDREDRSRRSGLSLVVYRQRCEGIAREKRDNEALKVRTQIDKRMATLQSQLAREKHGLASDRAELGDRKREELLTNAESVVNFVLGRRDRRMVSWGAVKRRQTQQSERDVQASEELIARLNSDLQIIADEYQHALSQISDKWMRALSDIQEVSIAPKKGDIFADLVALMWAA